MRNKNIILAVILFLTYSLSMAQSHNEEVTVEGTYTPQIKKSERLIKTPDMPKNDFFIPKYEVNTSDFFYDYKLDLEPISPQQYRNNESHDIINNFVRLGLGTRLSPELLFRHYSDISRKMSMGIGVLHNSTWLGMKDYPNAKYMNNAFSFSTTNRFSGFQLHSHIDYHYDMYYLNADSVAAPNTNEDLKRNIHTLNVKLLANNNQTSYKSLYNEYSLDYNYSGIPGGIQENMLRFNAYLEHSDSWFRKKKGIQTLAVDINADINVIKQTLFLLAINPRLDFDGDYYNLHLGLRFDIKTNSTSMGGIYPDLKGSLYLFERNFELYAGIGGMTSINTLDKILTENPFIISNIDNIGDFDYEKTNIDFQGGVRFKVYNNVSAHAGIRYRSINNHIFYINSDEVGRNTFDIVLNNCNVLNIKADIQVKMRDDFKLSFDFAYNNYQIKSSAENSDNIIYQKAWYKPNLEFTLRSMYQLNEQWSFNLAAYFEGKRLALVDSNKIEELKPLCDIQLGCNYSLNDNLSLFGEVKNLIHNKYQMYYGYPTYGIQGFVGFKYRF